MKAARIHRYGGPEVVVVEEAPDPEPLAGEVLLRVHAAGVNPVDWKTRSGGGMAKKFPPRFPITLGWDVSGVVEAVGPGGVDNLSEGDEVFGLIRFPEPAGTYAEYVTAPADQLATKPSSISHEEAAGVPMVALTAWQALFDAGHLGAGQTVLVHAAAGGVGHMAVQLAVWKGATVAGTASGARADFLKGLGAEQVVDYTQERFEDVAHDLDMVLDSIGGDVMERSLTVLRPDGMLVSLRADPGEKAEQHGVRAQRVLVHPDGAQLTEIAGLIDAGHLRPVVDQVLALEEVNQAHELSEAGHTVGKIVLQLRE
jgi:NADPH2:quinone reductase